MKKPTRKDYDAFRWLPLDQWNTDKLLGPIMGGTICCKICDTYIAMMDSKTHVEKHVTVRKRQLADDKKKASAARAEAMRLAREEKKRKKLAGNL